MKSTKMFVPDALNEARLIRGLSIKALADRVGRSYGAVWFTLHGKTQAPRLVFALCAELGVSTKRVWRSP